MTFDMLRPFFGFRPDRTVSEAKFVPGIYQAQSARAAGRRHALAPRSRLPRYCSTNEILPITGLASAKGEPAQSPPADRLACPIRTTSRRTAPSRARRDDRARA